MSTETLPLDIDDVMDVFSTTSINTQINGKSNPLGSIDPPEATTQQSVEDAGPRNSTPATNQSGSGNTSAATKQSAVQQNSPSTPHSPSGSSSSQGTTSRGDDTVEENREPNSVESVPKWHIPDSDNLADWIRAQMVLTPQLLRELQPKLVKPLKEVYNTAKLIQHADGHQTGKGYDTTGYEDQFIFDRLNELFPLGRANYRISYTITREVEITTAKGNKQWDIGMNMVIEIGNPVVFPDGTSHFIPILVLRGPGGAINKDYSNALKGAYANAFKRCIAELGPGREAFSGELAEEVRKQGEQFSTNRSGRTAVATNQRSTGSVQGGPHQNNNASNDRKNGNASTDPALDPPEYADDGTAILPFGEHAGKSLAVIYKHHKNFFLWLATECKRPMHPDLRAGIDKIYKLHLKKFGSGTNSTESTGS